MISPGKSKLLNNILYTQIESRKNLWGILRQSARLRSQMFSGLHHRIIPPLLLDY